LWIRPRKHEDGHQRRMSLAHPPDSQVIVGPFSSERRLEGVEVARMEERREPRSFEQLALPLLDSLYRYARWLTRDPTEAEDLVQEAFLKGLRGFDGFQPGSNIKAWMFRILRNTFLTSRSGLRAMPAASLDEDPTLLDEVSDDVTPESQLLQRADAESLRRAIEELPAQFREVLLLADAEEMRYEEIAQTLSIPIGTVTSRLIRARQKIRRALTGKK
ncbi:MAG: sigma-70 family RNA polymerase sigma factor, partial [Thermoanaerobaculia bacterium]